MRSGWGLGFGVKGVGIRDGDERFVVWGLASRLQRLGCRVLSGLLSVHAF